MAGTRPRTLMGTVFDSLDRPTLAVLVREYLLAGHLIDRAAMPPVFAAFGMEAMRDVAVEEWMGASPVYTRRMQRLLGFEGHDVETIFKGMQLDIGAPPQYMDFRYRVIDARHGEFALRYCGALMDVERMGQAFVVTTCHHIEDPTFDATAAATNPRARMRPVHRPPRRPPDRVPHCVWTVDIDETRDPLPTPEPALRVAASRAARIDLPRPEGPDSEGRTGYRGPLEPDLRLEAFSHHTLVTIAQEVCLQAHLLTLAFTHALERRYGPSVAEDIGCKRFTGAAGVAARRLRRALGLAGGPQDVATVLRLHPAFHPRSYVDLRVEAEGGVVVSLHDCPALGDRPGRSWAEVLAAGRTEPLEAIVQAVDPRARCLPVRVPGAVRAWRVERGELAPEPPEVAVARLSTGADFVFKER